MAIAIVFRRMGHADRTDATFDDLGEAVRHALRAADGGAMKMSASDRPTEVRVVDDGTMLLAIKVRPGGLLPTADPPPRAR